MQTRSLRLLAAAARAPVALVSSRRRNVELWANLAVLTWAVAFLLWQGPGFAVTVGTVFAIWAILAVSLNLVVGFTGLLSIAHIGFFGIGAYAMAILTSGTSYDALRTDAIPTFGWPFFAALPVSAAAAGLAAAVVGVVLNRFRDDIFVLVTFGFAIISYSVFLNWSELTRGAFGIHDIARPEVGGLVLDSDGEFLAFTLLCLALTVAVSWLVVSSSFGRVLLAIREDEGAAEVFGYRVSHYKFAVWVISAMLAGIAGGLFSSWTRFVDPYSFVLLESIVLVSVVILGGWRRSGAPCSACWPSSCWRRGCASSPFLPNESIGQARQAVLGVLLVLLMLFRPQGLVGKYRL